MCAFGSSPPCTDALQGACGPRRRPLRSSCRRTAEPPRRRKTRTSCRLDHSRIRPLPRGHPFNDIARQVSPVHPSGPGSNPRIGSLGASWPWAQALPPWPSSSAINAKSCTFKVFEKNAKDIASSTVRALTRPTENVVRKRKGKRIDCEYWKNRFRVRNP